MNPAALGQGVARVDHQVEDHLLEIVRIDDDGGRRAVVEIDGQVDVFADDAGQHLAETRERAIEIEAREPRVVLAAERQQLAGQGRAAFGRLADFVDRGLVQCLVPVRFHQDVGVSHGDGQEVVEVVRGAGDSWPTTSSSARSEPSSNSRTSSSA